MDSGNALHLGCNAARRALTPSSHSILPLKLGSAMLLHLVTTSMFSLLQQLYNACFLHCRTNDV